jgi:Arc/MetJ-type ribon-helix-helix transcriptional regulator
MVLTVRLDKEAQKKLDELAKATGRSKSEIVRDALRFYDPGASAEPELTVAERLADVIGTTSIGGNRAREGERILREAFARRRGSS